MGLFSSFGKLGITTVSVDYSQGEDLPQGTVSIHKHVPIAFGVKEIALKSIKLERIIPGETGFEFLQRRFDARFCDGKILNAIVNAGIKDAKTVSAAQKNLAALGNDRIIYFFGTTFYGANDEVMLPFLNLSNEVPALRYVTYMKGPMEHLPVPAYAALWDE